jgi:D-alanyl-D-alanine carboxypeptidase
MLPLLKLRGDGAQLSDAAFALAHHYGGLLGGRTDAESFALFMERINARAQELGLLDTQHLNPSGLAWDGHYSSE